MYILYIFKKISRQNTINFFTCLPSTLHLHDLILILILYRGIQAHEVVALKAQVINKVAECKLKQLQRSYLLHVSKS